MTNYADSTYYTGTYLAGKGAVIDTASFNYYARKATQIIKQHTFSNVNESSIPDEVKMCCCELAEEAYRHENAQSNGNVTSEKVGEYSVSYADNEKTENVYQAKCYDIVNQWLAMTGLLYRGCN